MQKRVAVALAGIAGVVLGLVAIIATPDATADTSVVGAATPTVIATAPIANPAVTASISSTVIATPSAVVSATPSVFVATTPSAVVTAKPSTTGANPPPTTSPTPTTNSTTPVATATASIAPTVVGWMGNGGVRTRFVVGARSFASAPSVDLRLVPVTSANVGPGQTIALDLQMRAGTTEIIGLDAYLDFDPLKIEVIGVDATDSPLTTTLQRTWDNSAGKLNLSYGAMVGLEGVGPSGVFVVARLTFRPVATFTATSSGTVASVAFAKDATTNRETMVLSRTDSVLRLASGQTIALVPDAVPVPTPAPPPFITLYNGVPGEISFVVRNATNQPAPGVAFNATYSGSGTLIGGSVVTDSGVFGTVQVVSGKTDASGRATVEVVSGSSAGSGVVDVTATVPGGGIVERSQVVRYSPAVAVAVAITAPTATLARGAVPLTASPTFGPVPLGTTFDVSWAFATSASGEYVPITTVPVVAGVATATWVTTLANLAPPGTTKSDVRLRATARALNAGVTVGVASASFGPMTIDNQAPTFHALFLNDREVFDAPGTRQRFATRTFTLTGETEAASTVVVYRVATIGGARTFLATGVATASATSLATGTFAIPLPAFALADELPTGFYLDIEATDPVGNVGPVTIANDGVTPNPATVWITLDTVAPRVASIATPTFTAGVTNGPAVITFTEPVEIATTDYGSLVRFEQAVNDVRVVVPATMTLVCATDPTPIDPTPTGPAGIEVGQVATSCPAGVTKVSIQPTSALYPGSTYTVTVRDASAPGDRSAVHDLTGTALLARDPSVADAPITNTTTFEAEGTIDYPQISITSILPEAVLHSTDQIRLPLTATTTFVDSVVTWRLCATMSCTTVDKTIASVPVGIVVEWNTTEVVNNVRQYPDTDDVYLIAEGRNSQLSGEKGVGRSIVPVSLRSTAPIVTTESVIAYPCVNGNAGSSSRAVASATFNRADDCDPSTPGLQVVFGGTIPDTHGGTITISGHVGTPTFVIASAVPFSRGQPASWNSGRVPVPDGRPVTLTIAATDTAYPVPNVAKPVSLEVTVDTNAPVNNVTYPPDRARLASASGTFSLPILGVAEAGATVALRLRRVGVNPELYTVTMPGTPTPRSKAPLRYPATGTLPVIPGLYELTAQSTDDVGNTGPVATSTFRITPPPPIALLNALGNLGRVGPTDDADRTSEGVQIILTGHLPVDTTAEQVPEGLLVRLLRNGKDATGDGNRPIVAPVTLASGTYSFAFPALTFTTDASAEYAVVTSDDAGNRSAVSSPITLTVDLTPPTVAIASPRPGATVGSRTPELAVVVEPTGSGTYDVVSVDFEVREAGTGTFRSIRTFTVDPATMGTSTGGAGVVRVGSTDWNPPLPQPSGIQQAYDLRVTITDVTGNKTTLDTTFVLRPGAPSIEVASGTARIFGSYDVVDDRAIDLTATTSVSEGVTVASVVASIRQRGTATDPPVPVTGVGPVRELNLAAVPLVNGAIYDLTVTVTDSNGASATNSVRLRIVRPRDLAVTVTRGATKVNNASVSLLREAGDLPGMSTTASTNDGVATFTGVAGGPTLVSIGGVAGYPVTTVAAMVSEPQAVAGSPWAFTIDLDALNPNLIVTTLRGLPDTVRNATALATVAQIDVQAAPGSRLIDASIAPGLTHTFSDTIAEVSRAISTPVLVKTGSVVTGTVRVPLGAVSWVVTPTLLASATSDAQLKGAPNANAVFAKATTGETLPISFRFSATNLRVKTLTGTITRPDTSVVSGATVVISQPGGLAIRTVSSVDGAFGPILLEAGDYTVTAVATPGADWLPDRAGRISFAGGDAPTAESGSVDLVVLAAGGTVEGRLTRADTSALTTGTVFLTGNGRVITGTAGSTVGPGADVSSGANFALAAPSGLYTLSVSPDDTALTPPDPVTVRVVAGKTTTVSSAELPPLSKTLGRITGLVRLTTGAPMVGLTVQARRDGDTSVIPATTGDSGTYTFAAPPGSYVVSAVIPRGASVLPGNAMPARVVAQTTVTAGDIVLAPATAVIERALETSSGPLTDDAGASIVGTAFVKNESTGAGTSIVFAGAKIRVSVPEGTYRLSIAITAGGYLAPVAETGVIASATTPNVAVGIVTPSNLELRGQLVSGQSGTQAGTPVAVRTIVRATGLSGVAMGVVNIAETTNAGAFSFKVAPGTWRLTAAPSASQGYLANPERPFTDVVVASNGTVTPSSPGIDLKPVQRIVTGKAVVEIGASRVPLAGVVMRLDVTGTGGGALSLGAETATDGTFAISAPDGSATLSASGATARYGATLGGVVVDEPAYVIDPAPRGVTSSDIGSLTFTNANIMVSGTVTLGTDLVAGAAITATSETGFVRTAVSLGGTKVGQYGLRLSAGKWTLAATADVTLANGGRVPATTLATPVTVGASDQTGIGLTLVASAVPLPPAASAGADAETGGQVRAGTGSAELRLSPGAVSEAVTVQIEPLGNATTLPGFVPFGDAFRVGATTASGQAVGTLAVDSTVLITYPAIALTKFKAPSTATHGLSVAQPSDVRAALFDATTGSYTPFTNVTHTTVDASTGQFVISTSTLGTFVLTTRESLVRIPPSVLSVTTTASGTKTSGDRITITITFTEAVTTTGVASLTLETGATDTVATCPVVTASTTLTCTYVVAATDLTTNLDYTATTALVGTISDIYGNGAVLTLPTIGTSGLYGAHIAIVAPTPPSAGGGTTSGGTTSGGSGGTVARPIVVPVVVAPAIVPVIPPTPVGITLPPSAVAPIVVPETRFDPRRPLRLPSPASGSQPLLIVAPDYSLVRLDGRTESRTTIPAGDTIAVVPVYDGEVAVAILPPGAKTIAFAAPSLAGVSGSAVAVSVPATLSEALRELGPNTIARVTFDPVPLTANVVERGSLGGGGIAALSLPFDVRLDIRDADGQPISATRLREGGAVVPSITVSLPVPARFTVGAGTFAYLVGLHDPVTAGFLGYLRLPSVFDVASGTQAMAVGADLLNGTFFLPVEISVAYVATHRASARLWSGPTDDAVDFGPVGEAFTTLTVVAPQVAGRIFVLNPLTKNYGWVDVADVGPAEPPLSTSIPNESSSVAHASTGSGVPSAPTQVRNKNAQVHLWSEPYAFAVDFGPIGMADVVFDVVDGPENGHLFVRSTNSGRYAWIDINDLAADTSPEISASSEAAPVAITGVRYVQNFSATARLFSSPYDDAADFGAVGVAFATFLVVDGPVNGHLYVYNPTSKNYGWIEARDVGPSGPP